ncbi:MAG: histidine triad family protein [Candidatus Woesearchaeota archaeon]|nr:histidine triad family protein [Candidatus Woesearchaeota archaeon]MDN5327498.1 histidine triad family protein [Candidatus Woesearchaeota archaeon]
MDENCLFCKIINKEIPSFIINETKTFITVLDINPANLGHCLIIPKEHVPFSSMITKEVYNEISKEIKRLSVLFLRVLKSRGSSMFIANGGVAGQRVPHCVIHVIPRYLEDGLNLNIQANEISEEEIKEVYAKFITPQKE